MNIQPPAASPASVASQGRSAVVGSPTEELRDLHVVMLTKQLAEVQKKVKDLEADNLRLKEQVSLLQAARAPCVAVYVVPALMHGSSIRMALATLHTE